ncbi:hypothetical protein RJT34_32724 [Clitoria ternatea]|uniref:Uncharacterized protein n=1 Tax=Clitoria ternatea TaxID=43366 RepID=A0AAN9EZ04_CLITE
MNLNFILYQFLWFSIRFDSISGRVGGVQSSYDGSKVRRELSATTVGTINPIGDNGHYQPSGEAYYAHDRHID